jgi:diguanylate cyclase (GGDEF)-like protein/PAS domain S-box-containing protein
MNDKPGEIYHDEEAKLEHEILPNIASTPDELVFVLNEALKNTHDSIIITDGEGKALWVDDSFVKVSGYTLGEVIGKIPRVLHPSYHNPEVFDALMNALESGQVWEGEFDSHCKNDSDCHQHLIITPVIKDGNLKHIIICASDISDRVAAEKKALHNEMHDPITKLPNRLLLHDRIEVAISQVDIEVSQVAVLFFNINFFNRVNDTLGYPVGDELLRMVADRIQEALGNTGSVARIGGDNFLILLPEVSDPGEAADMAQRIIEHVSKPIQIGSHTFEITSNVGVALYPSDGNNADDLQRHSDIAMHQAKTIGKNIVQISTPKTNQDYLELQMQREELRFAIENGCIRPHYQPIIDIQTGKVVGAEALSRWEKETGEVVMPGAFIKLAEESLLIIPLGQKIIQAASRDARAWPRLNGSPARISVNVSPRQFHQPNIIEMIDLALSESTLEPENLEIEITEGIAMEDPDRAAEVFAQLRNRGIGLAIDDFGTGYSSLSYLDKFPITTLKIDRSFVAGLGKDKSKIIEAIVAMAHSLGINIVAEGVETEQQLASLRDIGCREAQGYLFDKALPQSEFVELINQRQHPYFSRNALN